MPTPTPTQQLTKLMNNAKKRFEKKKNEDIQGWINEETTEKINENDWSPANLRERAIAHFLEEEDLYKQMQKYFMEAVPSSYISNYKKEFDMLIKKYKENPTAFDQLAKKFLPPEYFTDKEKPPITPNSLLGKTIILLSNYEFGRNAPKPSLFQRIRNRFNKEPLVDALKAAVDRRINFGRTQTHLPIKDRLPSENEIVTCLLQASLESKTKKRLGGMISFLLGSADVKTLESVHKNDGQKQTPLSTLIKTDKNASGHKQKLTSR